MNKPVKTVNKRHATRENISQQPRKQKKENEEFEEVDKKTKTQKEQKAQQKATKIARGNQLATNPLTTNPTQLKETEYNHMQPLTLKDKLFKANTKVPNPTATPPKNNICIPSCQRSSPHISQATLDAVPSAPRRAQRWPRPVPKGGEPFEGRASGVEKPGV